MFRFNFPMSIPPGRDTARETQLELLRILPRRQCRRHGTMRVPCLVIGRNGASCWAGPVGCGVHVPVNSGRGPCRFFHRVDNFCSIPLPVAREPCRGPVFWAPGQPGNSITSTSRITSYSMNSRNLKSPPTSTLPTSASLDLHRETKNRFKNVLLF